MQNSLLLLLLLLFVGRGKGYSNYTSTFPVLWMWFFQLKLSDLESSSSSMPSPPAVEVPPVLPHNCRGPWGDPDWELLPFDAMASSDCPPDGHRPPKTHTGWFVGGAATVRILRV